MPRPMCIVLPRMFYILAWLTQGVCCAGLTEDPRSWKIVSPNRRFVFVSIAPVPLDEELATIRSEESGKNTNIGSKAVDDLIANARHIRDKYPASGMYRNAGSMIPLWTIKEWVNAADIACDGKHIVVPGSWTREPQGDYVAHFIANGKTLRNVTILDIACQFILHRIVDGRGHEAWGAGEEASP